MASQYLWYLYCNLLLYPYSVRLQAVSVSGFKRMYNFKEEAFSPPESPKNKTQTNKTGLMADSVIFPTGNFVKLHKCGNFYYVWVF